VFSAGASAAQESLWYAIYAATLWLLVALIAITYGKRLSRQHHS